ncbi:MAG TPA: MFS transporter [Terriglobales bacterium]|nr:MFS transporter [Terriglobales bacterium]
MSATAFQPNQSISEDSIRYPGWGVCVAAFVGVMVSFAAIMPYTFSLFIEPLAKTFGWHREAISNAFGIAAITVAVFSPGIGTLLDRFPPRRIILPSILVFAAAYASLSLLTPNITRFYLTYFVLGVVGNSTAQLAYTRAVLTWFQKHRGLALAIVLTGSGTGSIVIPLVTQAIIHHYDWRHGYLALGCIALLGIPLTALLVRNRPVPIAQAANHHFQTGVSMGAALRSVIFWILAFMIMLEAFGSNGLISHLAALLTERGVSPQSAALALSVMGAAGILGRLTTGVLLDRYFAPYIAALMLAISGIGILALTTAASAPVALLGTGLMGYGLGSEADVVPYLIARYFGRKHFAALYGLTWTAYAVGGATGPIVVGHFYDRAGMYQPSMIVGLALTCILGAALSLLLPRYPAEQTRTAESAIPRALLTENQG